jgi:hypothetical protein
MGFTGQFIISDQAIFTYNVLYSWYSWTNNESKNNIYNLTLVQ